MLTALQRAAILEFAVQPDVDQPDFGDDDIWYGFLSGLFGAGKTLKDLKLSPAQQPEIMACLRRAPSVAPRTFQRRGARVARATPTAASTPAPRQPDR